MHSPDHVNEHDASPSPGIERKDKNFRMKYYSAIETTHRIQSAKEVFAQELP